VDLAYCKRAADKNAVSGQAKAISSLAREGDWCENASTARGSFVVSVRCTLLFRPARMARRGTPPAGLLARMKLGLNQLCAQHLLVNGFFGWKEQAELEEERFHLMGERI